MQENVISKNQNRGNRTRFSFKAIHQHSRNLYSICDGNLLSFIIDLVKSNQASRLLQSQT